MVTWHTDKRAWLVSHRWSLATLALLLIAAAVFFILFGHAIFDRFSIREFQTDITAGMMKSEVIRVIGRPNYKNENVDLTEIGLVGKGEVWTYTRREKGALYPKDYVIYLLGDKVVFKTIEEL